jgi:RHS repeat-associated protein
LGSTSYVTDANGDVVQYIAYMPFGETLAEQHADWDSPYKFNAKELDSETGLYYYGARYYDPKTSVWISVDPLVEQFPSVSPYNYCLNNPVILSDPNGESPTLVTAAIGFGVGALIGGAIEIGTQLYKEGSVTNWKAVGGSALQGGITGGVAGLTGGASLLVTAAASGGANAVGGVLNDVIQGKPVTVTSVTSDMALGIAFGAAGKYISKFINVKGGGKIFTSGIAHGTEKHWNTITTLAKSLASKGETVYLNKSINTAIGKTIEGVGNWRPDVLSISKNGIINITEVISPSQTSKEILQKTATMAKALIGKGYKVTTKVLDEGGKIVTK